VVSLVSGANVETFGTYYMSVHSISIDKLEIKCVQGSWVHSRLGGFLHTRKFEFLSHSGACVLPLCPKGLRATSYL